MYKQETHSAFDSYSDGADIQSFKNINIQSELSSSELLGGTSNVVKNYNVAFKLSEDKMKRYINLIVALFMLSSLSITISAKAALATFPGLSVSGTAIVANSQPVRLRGINMGDPFWARNPSWYPNYSLADYTTLAQDWQANVVRISIFPTQWKNMDHTVLLDGLSQQINAALNNKLYVIISYHVIG